MIRTRDAHLRRWPWRPCRSLFKSEWICPAERGSNVKIVGKMNSRSRKVEKSKTKKCFWSNWTIQTCWPCDLKKNVRSKSQKCLVFPFVVSTPSPCSFCWWACVISQQLDVQFICPVLVSCGSHRRWIGARPWDWNRTNSAFVVPCLVLVAWY